MVTIDELGNILDDPHGAVKSIKRTFYVNEEEVYSDHTKQGEEQPTVDLNPSGMDRNVDTEAFNHYIQQQLETYK